VHLTRREALQRLSGLVGAALSSSTVAALLSGCRAEPAPAGWAPQALSPDQADLLGTLVDHIIPRTDTPGARDVGVPAFIDKLLHDWVDPQDRAQFVNGLAGLDDQTRRADGVAFQEATTEQRQAIVARLDREAIEARQAGAESLPFFAVLKEWTLVGYYTSEAGATEELQWLAAPGRYDADLPLEQVGRTWA
jgi:hypothetical protein